MTMAIKGKPKEESPEETPVEESARVREMRIALAESNAQNTRSQAALRDSYEKAIEALKTRQSETLIDQAAGFSHRIKELQEKHEAEMRGPINSLKQALEEKDTESKGSLAAQRNMYEEQLKARAVEYGELLARHNRLSARLDRQSDPKRKKKQWQRIFWEQLRRALVPEEFGSTI